MPLCMPHTSIFCRHHATKQRRVPTPCVPNPLYPVPDVMAVNQDQEFAGGAESGAAHLERKGGEAKMDVEEPKHLEKEETAREEDQKKGLETLEDGRKKRFKREKETKEQEDQKRLHAAEAEKKQQLKKEKEDRERQEGHAPQSDHNHVSVDEAGAKQVKHEDGGEYLKPCARCKDSRKGVGYCMRMGHTPLSTYAEDKMEEETAAEEEEDAEEDEQEAHRGHGKDKVLGLDGTENFKPCPRCKGNRKGVAYRQQVG